MSDQARCTEPAGRRRGRYVLVLLATAAVLGSPMALDLALRMWKYEKQLLLAETLRRGGAVVAYPSLEEGEPAGPRWLRTILGEDFIDENPLVVVPTPGPPLTKCSTFPLWGISELRLTDGQLNAVDLGRLRWLRELATLSLEGTQATDEHLRHIAKLRRLRTLILNGTRISDAGLRHLKALKNLEVLELEQGDHPRITDAGARELEQFRQLRLLRLSADRLSEQAIDRLYKAFGSKRIVLCYHGGFEGTKPNCKDPPR